MHLVESLPIHATPVRFPPGRPDGGRIGESGQKSPTGPRCRLRPPPRPHGSVRHRPVATMRPRALTPGHVGSLRQVLRSRASAATAPAGNRSTSSTAVTSTSRAIIIRSRRSGVLGRRRRRCPCRKQAANPGSAALIRGSISLIFVPFVSIKHLASVARTCQPVTDRCRGAAANAPGRRHSNASRWVAARVHRSCSSSCSVSSSSRSRIDSRSGAAE
jgi:hypothetical protein